MATLVLTTIGTIVGGPIGGAIGAALGQQVDRQLFAPKGRRGPRLNELAVQVSTYGQPIPKLFGRLRVAGSVIWSTDLREERHRSGGGKSGPSTTTYSYSVSFAVALSARPIRAVHRIWADGKLLRGAAGDWKSQTGFRLHTGSEGQAIDPLIAAAEGAEGAPAYRGMAYAVFEDMQLADYGNHIPSLTFEVEADEEPVPIGQIAHELSGGDLTGTTSATLGGYAATGDSVRAAIEALASAKPMSLLDDGAVLRISDAAPAAQNLSEQELGASADGRPIARRSVDRQAAGTLPDEIVLGYYEPSRDYQTGLQRARRGGSGRRTDTIELPAAMEAPEAKACAERRLAQLWSERLSGTVALPWRRMELRPGGRISLAGAGEWRIAGWTLERMVAELKVVGVPAGNVGGAGATAGRGTPGVDSPHGPTVVQLLDLPPQGDISDDAARLWIAASGPELGWRRAELSVSLDGGASWSGIGSTAPPAVMGSALNVLPGGGAALFDRAANVDVELLNEAMELQSCEDDRLAAGTNLAMLGDELIQFGSAQQIGVRRYRLSRLLRGRRGSEWAMAGHASGEPFVLLESATLLPLDLAPAGPGTLVKLLAQGVGDISGAVSAERLFDGSALRPPAPVHLMGARLADGTVRIGWTRRSRRGWGWIDGSDAPLGEEAERYRLMLAPSIGEPRTIEIIAPYYEYTPAEQASDGSGSASSIEVTVVQLGSLAPSRSATRIINL